MIPPIVILFIALVLAAPITLPMLLIAVFQEWRMSKGWIKPTPEEIWFLNKYRT